MTRWSWLHYPCSHERPLESSERWLCSIGPEELHTSRLLSTATLDGCVGHLDGAADRVHVDGLKVAPSRTELRWFACDMALSDKCRVRMTRQPELEPLPWRCRRLHLKSFRNLA
jgi:hypothetical protein